MRRHSTDELQRMFEEIALGSPEQRRAFTGSVESTQTETPTLAIFIRAQSSTLPIEDDTDA